MSLMELLPDYYSGNATMEELQAILGEEVDRIATGMQETINQCFVNTATSLLSRYEKIYGLSVDVTKSDDFRRERIRAKIRGTGTVTKQMIAEVAKSYSFAEVEVVEDNLHSCFTIKFVGTMGLPPNMGDLTLTIEEIKPAHLSYTFEYVYRTHNELKSYTHNQLKTFTHRTIREGEM